MVADRPSSTRTRKRVRLWPLMSLPMVGLAGGYYVGTQGVRPPFLHGSLDRPEASALGTLLGCGLMIVIASAVLAYRIARSRFTIGAMLFTIAVVAVLLWLARMVVS
jgi:hypothetical protein